MTIADYCRAFNDKSITVNRDYQRSGKIWPPSARSFLIESIVLGYPVPKLSLHQRLDVRSRRTVKEIVDGQQRTAAILEFFDGDLRLSGNLETEALAGHTYPELDEESQAAFLNYSLPIDLFIGTTPHEIREVFRRMNSYTVPVNPEEDRHARFQGQFKWHIYHLSRSLEEILEKTGVFAGRSFIRMQDAKLLTEISHAMHHGIATTSKHHLTRMYKAYDSCFPGAQRDSNALTSAFSVLNRMEELHSGPLMTGYVVYSLILAIIQHQTPLEVLDTHVQGEPRNVLDLRVAVEGLQRLAEALEEKDDYGGALRPFVSACLSRTNVADQRATRFLWLYRALNGTLPTE